MHWHTVSENEVMPPNFQAWQLMETKMGFSSDKLQSKQHQLTYKLHNN